MSEGACPNDHRIEVLEKQYEKLQESIKKMEDKFDSKLDLILFQINKIAVLEANHNNHSAAVNRAFGRLEDVQKELDNLKQFQSHTEGMARMAWLLWGTIGAAVAGIIFKVFLHGG
jgi:hypothetical protein